MTDYEKNFETDVARLLDIVANALYTNPDVFLRELISNAADACDRLRYEGMRDPALIVGDPDFKIRVTVDPDANTLTVADNGIGMNDKDLAENLGTIAHSGAAAMMEQVKDAGGDLSLIGQFGVGFYASFMVADTVTVISRKAGEETVFAWESDGRTGFTVRQADTAQADALPGGRGAAVILNLKPTARDYLSYDTLKRVIRTYSDHVSVPVHAGEEDEPLNAAAALWMRPKSEVREEQYKEFYRHIAQAFDDPILTSHWRAEGKLEFSVLLFVPSMRPWDLYDPSRRAAVRLYVKRVFITDQSEHLVYPWLRFVRGVIDSEDLPLNISREMLQRNAIVDTIRRSVSKRILSDIAKLADNDKQAFDTLWRQFGMVIKEGLYDAVEHREEIFKICRFFSSETGEEMISLDDYLTGMKEGQTSIYYMTGDDLDALRASPQLEGFRARGLNVLLMTDAVDGAWLQNVREYDKTPFQSAAKGEIDLSRFDAGDENTDGDAAAEGEQPDDQSANDLLAFLKEALKDDVHDVRFSSRLTQSPVCLVAPDLGLDMHMESVLQLSQKSNPRTRPVLEVNRRHPLITCLAGLSDGAARTDAARLLLDQARIVQGQNLPDPAAFSQRMAHFMERGLAGPRS